LHALFMTRTLGLFDRLGPTQAADYLSGLLIGAEIAAATQAAKAATVVASAGLTERYRRAGARLGVALTPAPDHCALWGQMALLAARQKAVA